MSIVFPSIHEYITLNSNDGRHRATQQRERHLLHHKQTYSCLLYYFALMIGVYAPMVVPKYLGTLLNQSPGSSIARCGYSNFRPVKTCKRKKIKTEVFVCIVKFPCRFCNRKYIY